MNTSEKVQKAFENALQFGDSEEVTDGLKADLEVFSHYILWDEFESTGPVPSFSLKHILIAGAEADQDARSTGRQAFVLTDDGNGCHILLAHDESTLVEALTVTAAKMKDSCHV